MSGRRLSLVVLLCVLIGVLWRMGYIDQVTRAVSSVTIRHESVHYGAGASPGDARKVAEFLDSIDFSPDHVTHVQVSRHDGHLVVAFPDWMKHVGDNTPWISGMLMNTMQIANQKFDGAPVEMDLVDTNWAPTQRFMLIMNHAVKFQSTVGQPGQVWYGDDLTAADAHKVAAVMTASNFAGDVGLSKPNHAPAVFSVMVEGGWNDPATEQYVRDLATKVSQSVLNGAPLSIQICGDGFYLHKTIAR